jgi:branched-subunit amino acid transport protein
MAMSVLRRVLRRFNRYLPYKRKVLVATALWIASLLGLWVALGSSLHWHILLAGITLIGAAIGVCLALLDQGRDP